MSAEYNPIYNAGNDLIILRGATITKLYSYFDNLHTAQTPDSITIKLTAPNLAQYTFTPSPRAVGKYLLSYKVPSNAQVGKWTVVVTVIKGVTSQTDTETFIVE
jgi:hypothetical protein